MSKHTWGLTGLHNKPTGCSASGAYAPGPEEEEEEKKKKEEEVFIRKPCKKRVDGLLKLSRHLLKTAVAVFTGHAPVRKHLVIMGLFDGDPTCKFCRKETETVHHIICCC
jgi:hypothetical protein